LTYTIEDSHGLAGTTSASVLVDVYQCRDLETFFTREPFIPVVPEQARAQLAVTNWCFNGTSQTVEASRDTFVEPTLGAASPIFDFNEDVEFVFNTPDPTLPAIARLTFTTQLCVGVDVTLPGGVLAGLIQVAAGYAPIKFIRDLVEEAQDLGIEACGDIYTFETEYRVTPTGTYSSAWSMTLHEKQKPSTPWHVTTEFGWGDFDGNKTSHGDQTVCTWVTGPDPDCDPG
jgi:hypothetical protein